VTYNINIRRVGEVYGPHRGKYGAKTTLGTRPLLAMLLDTGTKKNTMYRKGKISDHRCPVLVFRRKTIRMKDHV
jgi:hypothetical protein